MTLEQSRERFDTTIWTRVRALEEDDEEQRRAILNVLVMQYWPPVYAQLRGRGLNRHEAAELTQAFFSEVVIGRRLFEKADSARGSSGHSYSRH